MKKKRKYVERQSGVPFIWGWDDESIFFIPDGESLRGDDERRIQDYPDLHRKILDLCSEYFRAKEGE